MVIQDRQNPPLNNPQDRHHQGSERQRHRSRAPSSFLHVKNSRNNPGESPGSRNEMTSFMASTGHSRWLCATIQHT